MIDTANRPMLERLKEDRIFKVSELPADELRRCVAITEKCDGHYESILTTIELRQLAAELIGIADEIDIKQPQ